MSFDNLFHGSADVPNNTQWRIKAESLLSDCDIWTPTSDKRFPLGAIAEARDGRRWRYCKNGSGTLVLGNVQQSAVAIANNEYEVQTNSPGVPTAGDKTVTVTSAAAFAIHALVDGYLYLPDGTGQGSMYTIKDNKVSTSNATSGYDTIIEIADVGGIRTAWATTSDITLWANKYRDTIIFPTDPTGPCAGISMTAVTAEYYYWAQTRGYCPVLNASDTIVIGDRVCAGVTAGCVALPDDDATADEGDVVIGYCAKAPAATSDYAVIDLTIE